MDNPHVILQNKLVLFSVLTRCHGRDNVQDCGLVLVIGQDSWVLDRNVQ